MGGMVIRITGMADTMAVAIMEVAAIIVLLTIDHQTDLIDQDQSNLFIDRTDRRHYRQDPQQDQVPDPLEI